MKLLLVDDDKGWSVRPVARLKDLGFEVQFEADANNAMKVIRSFDPDVVLLDVLFEVQDQEGPPKFENMGKPTFEKIKERYPNLPVVILTSTMRDTFSKKDYPGCAFAFAKDQLSSGLDEVYKEFAEKIKRAAETNMVAKEDYTKQFSFVVGKTKAMREVCEKIMLFAPTTLTVLVPGESGTGKELVAKEIHDKSERKDKPYVARSCHDFPDENMLKSELFGHERGAFTGADWTRMGIFEMANGGTVFIDEIGDAPLAVQATLLRVLQEKVIRRLGGTKDIKVDIRVIAATNKNLFDEIKASRFREDLFYRLQQSEIHLPPLRERKDDISELLAYFIVKLNKTLKKNILVETKEGAGDYLRADVLELLRSHEWPGNIREFENEVAKAMVTAGDDNVLLTEHFRLESSDKNDSPGTLSDIDEIVRSLWEGRTKWADVMREFGTNGTIRCQVLKGFIDRWLNENGVRPTSRELGEFLGESRNNMAQKLTECGFQLRRDWPSRKPK